MSVSWSNYDVFSRSNINSYFSEKKYIQEDRLWGAFRVFDRDGDGKITRQELAEVLNNGDVGDIVDGHIDEILKQADANGDGEIDFDEFVAMMEKQ